MRMCVVVNSVLDRLSLRWGHVICSTKARGTGGMGRNRRHRRSHRGDRQAQPVDMGRLPRARSSGGWKLAVGSTRGNSGAADCQGAGAIMTDIINVAAGVPLTPALATIQHTAVAAAISEKDLED